MKYLRYDDAVILSHRIDAEMILSSFYDGRIERNVCGSAPAFQQAANVYAA